MNYLMVMASSRHSSRKSGNDFTVDPQLIVEERIVKVNGEITVRKYAKGRFLGKVKILLPYTKINF